MSSVVNLVKYAMDYFVFVGAYDGYRKQGFENSSGTIHMPCHNSTECVQNNLEATPSYFFGTIQTLKMGAVRAAIGAGFAAAVGVSISGGAALGIGYVLTRKVCLLADSGLIKLNTCSCSVFHPKPSQEELAAKAKKAWLEADRARRDKSVAHPKPSREELEAKKAWLEAYHARRDKSEVHPKPSQEELEAEAEEAWLEAKAEEAWEKADCAWRNKMNSFMRVLEGGGALYAVSVLTGCGLLGVPALVVAAYISCFSLNRALWSIIDAYNKKTDNYKITFSAQEFVHCSISKSIGTAAYMLGLKVALVAAVKFGVISAFAASLPLSVPFGVAMGAVGLGMIAFQAVTFEFPLEEKNHNGCRFKIFLINYV